MSGAAEKEMGARLAAHRRECDECAREPVETDALARVFARWEVDVDAAALSAVALACAGAELAARARAVFRRQVGVMLLLALIPLPGLLIFGFYGLRFAYQAVAVVLPPTVAEYLVVSYALSALVVLTASYASIPLLLERLRARPAAPVKLLLRKIR